MSEYVYDQSEAIYAYFKASGEVELPAGNTFAIGLRIGENCVGACVYHNWKPLHRTIGVDMGFSSPLWARPDHIARFLAYPFVELGAYKIWGLCHSDNTPARRMHEHMGFTVDAELKDQFGPGKDGVLVAMRLPTYMEKY